MPYYKKSKTKFSKRQMKKPMAVTLVRKPKKPYGPTADKVFDKTISFMLYNSQTSQGAGYLFNTKLAATQGNMSFKLSLIPGLSPYPSIFSHYRFNWIKLRFIPITVDFQVEDSDTGTSASNISKLTPLIYVKRLYGNEAVTDLEFGNEDQCLLDGCRPYKMTKPFSIKFVPSSLAVHQTTRNSTSVVNPAYKVEKKQWYGFDSPDVNYYGLKWLCSNTNSDTGEFQYRIVATASVSFKGQNDSTTSSISGLAYTVISNF